MKKLITFIIIVTLTLSCFLSVNINAADSFGKAEAEALLIEAYQRYMLAQKYDTSSSELYLKDDHIGKSSSVPAGSFGDGELEFELSSNGLSYTGIPPYFIPAVDSRFDTMEKCYSYMEEVFTEDWARLIIDVHHTSTPQDIQESFRTSEGGILNYYESGKASVPIEQDAKWRAIKVVYNAFANGEPETLGRLASIGDFNLNGNTATLNVVFSYVNRDMGLKKEYLDKEVTFKKTSDGWRVSGGSFFEAMHLYNFNGENPLTSDSTVPAVAILGTVAVISLALPVVIYKRKRRAV